MKILFILAASFLFSASSSAEAIKKERGKYWYEDPPPQKEEEVKQQEEVAALQQHPRPTVPRMEEIMKMHPKDIAKLYEDVHDYHVMKPTMDTAVDLLVIENVLAKKSRAAAAVKKLAGLHNPALTGQFENPIAPSVKNIANRQQSLAVNDRLSKEREKYALIVFTQPTCAACKVFKNTLSLFNDKYGWSIKEVNIQQNHEAATRFGIYGTPTTILISKGQSNWLPIAQGAEPFTSLVKNASQGVRLLNGEITPEQWYTSDIQTDSYFDPEFTPVELRKE